MKQDNWITLNGEVPHQEMHNLPETTHQPLEQIMGHLPSLRVASGLPPFCNTAMDMFGPFHIRLNRKTLKEAQVITFTCMRTRTVHLELVTDKSTDTFLLAFRRFACLRGHPNTCWSDC